MSTVIKQLEDATAAIAVLTTERDTFKASVESFASQKAELEKTGEGFRQSLADAIAKADATTSDLTAKLEAETAAKAAAEKAQAESAAELAKLKAIVAGNPAFADAAAKGAKPVADVGTNMPSSMTYPEFQKLSQSERMAFSVRGGRITA